MALINTHAPIKILLVVLLILTGPSLLDAKSERNRTPKFDRQTAVLLRQSLTRNSQAQGPTQDKSKADAGMAAFQQAEQLRAEGSAESLKRAVEKFEEALLLFRSIAAQDAEAITLYRIGEVYVSLGERRKALVYFKQALPLWRAIGERSWEVDTLNNIGTTLHRLGETTEALSYHNQALPIRRELGSPIGIATTLSNIGAVYDDLGDKEKALDYYNQALRLSRSGGDRGAEASILHNIGMLNGDLGQKEKALDYFNQALPIRREVRDHSGEAETLNSIGTTYDDLGQKEKALSFYNQALLLKRDVGDRDGEANVLNNIGTTYRDLGKDKEALRHFNQALLRRVELHDDSGAAAVLLNLGSVYSDLGEQKKALEYFNQALPLKRAMGDRSGEAATLNNIGYAYAKSGDRQQALNYFNQALALLRAIGGINDEATTLGSLMSVWKDSNPSLAIFYGKQAVNTLQQLRANISGLDKDTQRTFLKSKEDTYRELATLLIANGRLPEAQQVLGMLKDEEYFEFVRRDVDALSPTGVRITFSPAEAELEKRFSEVADRITNIGAQRSALVARKQRTPKEETTLTELEAQLEIANLAFQKFLDQLEVELKHAKPGSSDVTTLRDQQALKKTLRDFDAIALYTIVGNDKYNIILITPDAQKAYEYKISETELNKKVLAFREALENPNSDPRLPAKNVYDIVIGPELARDIAQTGKKTLLWSLDGTLRYAPVAALHDGEKYLVESYQNVVITLASHSRLDHPVSPKWQALGLGVSKGESFDEPDFRVSFPPLPGVRDELSGIVRDATRGAQKGVLPGKLMLDADFTAEAMKAALRLRGNQQTYKLVHIASHFNFEPGDETKSFLLLGLRQRLTVAQLKSMSQIFDGVELLTLSACNTATGGQGGGIEVEGVAVSAQRQGAEAVIASLWKVADPSTSQLMQSFYRLREERAGMSKAEAMRQAQLSLLHPERASNAPYAHPYFWAPFILIGNWR